MIKIVSMWLAAATLALTSGCTIHQSIGDSFGSAVRKPHGENFEAKTFKSEYKALLYVYRPANDWSMDEFEAPSFNMNGKRLFNLKGGAYTWYELQPGSYDIVMRRGLLGFEGVNNLVLSTVASMHLEVQAGKTYYLRYSEVEPPKVSADSTAAVLGDGPLQLVDTALALTELPVTKMLHHGGASLNAKAQEEDKDLQRVFDGSIDGKTSSKDSSKDNNKNTKAADNAEPAAPATEQKNEGWWPF